MKIIDRPATPALTRYAPTPSGFLHLGNIYSFVITALLAKKSGSKILLRIDDIDKDRTKTKYIVDIFDSLDFLELPYHIGPKSIVDFKQNFSQHTRLALYQKYLTDLKSSNILFACDCSRKEILKLNPKGFYTGTCINSAIPYDTHDTAWRVVTTPKLKVSYFDWSGGLKEAKLPGILRDFIVRKKDGRPAYQLCSVADDIYFGVNGIVRGNDLFGSTLAQIYLSNFINPSFKATRFYHHPLLLGNDSKKLSKSAGATSINFLRKSGKKKPEIYGMLARMLGIKVAVRDWEDFEGWIGG